MSSVSSQGPQSRNGDGSREEAEANEEGKRGVDVVMPLADSTSTPTAAPNTRAGGDVPMPAATLNANTNTLAAAARTTSTPT
ncbi:hypothetical protein C8F04DRAFT_1232448, partial [Mycena alexandri]